MLLLTTLSIPLRKWGEIFWLCELMNFCTHLAQKHLDAYRLTLVVSINAVHCQLLALGMERLDWYRNLRITFIVDAWKRRIWKGAQRIFRKLNMCEYLNSNLTSLYWAFACQNRW